MKETSVPITIREIEELGLKIGSQTRYKNSHVIKALIEYNRDIGGASTIKCLKKSFLRLPMFYGLTIKC